MKKAFTLVEVLVAISILIILVVSIFSVLLYGIKSNLKAKYKSLATSALNTEMEIIRDTSFSSLPLQTDGPFLGTTPDLAKLPNGQGKLTIENYAESNQIKKVLIKVSWREQEINKSLSLTTLVSKDGINR